jgi:hypothetical protein
MRIAKLHKKRNELSVVALTLTMKALLWVFGLMVVEILNPTTQLTSLKGCFELWNQWDATHYLQIAQYGYGPVGDARLMLAFWPLYPLTIRAAAVVFRNLFASQLIVSTIASVVVSLELYQLVRMDYGHRLAYLAVWFLLIFPTSYFLQAGYTESLFLALTLGTFLAVRRDRWLIAGTLALLTTVTHINGILLVLAIATEALMAWRVDWHFKVRWLWTGLPSLGLAGYMLFNWHLTGDPLAFLTVQTEHWINTTVLPWHGIAGTVGVALHYGSPANQMIGVQVLLFMLWAAIATIGSALLLRPSYTVWMASNWLLLSCQSWDISAPRVMLCMFPMFILMAKLSSNRLAYAALTVWSVMWLGTFVGQFVVGHWTF